MIRVEPAQNIKDGIQNLINASIEDYNQDCDNKNMREEFANSWSVKEGPKFIKLVAKHSVHSFIVKKAFKHFKLTNSYSSNLIDSIRKKLTYNKANLNLCSFKSLKIL